MSMVIFADEGGAPVTEGGAPPDWGLWESTRADEDVGEDGSVTVTVRCRRRTDAEVEAAEAERRAERMAGQAATALALMVRAARLDDAQALQVEAFYPDWGPGGDYAAGDVVRHSGGLYRVLQDVRRAQADHSPDRAVSLYKRIGEPSGGVFPWSQPLGATDAYKRGDRVTHNGRTWVSDIDGNVWEPGVYGWTEVSE